MPRWIYKVLTWKRLVLKHLAQVGPDGDRSVLRQRAVLLASGRVDFEAAAGIAAALRSLNAFELGTVLPKGATGSELHRLRLGSLLDSSKHIYIYFFFRTHLIMLFHCIRCRSDLALHWVSLIHLVCFPWPIRFEDWSGETTPCDQDAVPLVASFSLRVLAGLLCVGEAWPKATVEALGDSVQASELASCEPGNGTKVPLTLVCSRSLIWFTSSNLWILCAFPYWRKRTTLLRWTLRWIRW